MVFPRARARTCDQGHSVFIIEREKEMLCHSQGEGEACCHHHQEGKGEGEGKSDHKDRPLLLRGQGHVITTTTTTTMLSCKSNSVVGVIGVVLPLLHCHWSDA